MNSAKKKQLAKEYRKQFYAELIGWSLIGALTYFTMKCFYWFTVVMLSF